MFPRVTQRQLGRLKKEAIAFGIVCAYVALPVGAIFFVKSHTSAFAERDASAVAIQLSTSWDLERMHAQYDTAVKEILQRIEFQHTLLVFRYGASGALLTFLLSSSLREVVCRWLGLGTPRPSLPAYGARRASVVGIRARFDGAYVLVTLWLTTLVSTTLDVQLAFNDSIITHLGSWIRNSFEVAGGQIPGWEHHFGRVNQHQWRFAKWATYGMTLLLVACSLFATWFALRRGLLTRRPILLELVVSMACVAGVAGLMAYGVWIHQASTVPMPYPLTVHATLRRAQSLAPIPAHQPQNPNVPVCPVIEAHTPPPASTQWVPGGREGFVEFGF